MPAYVAFLRAINLGAKRRFPMAELRAALEEAGYTDVETHLNTGNVRLRCGLRTTGRVEQELDRVLTRDRGFTVQTVVLTPVELAGLADDVEELGAAHPARNHYVSLLREEPARDLADLLETGDAEGETVVVRGRAVHLIHAEDYARASNTNATVERSLGVATNRNARVVRAVAEKWSR